MDIDGVFEPSWVGFNCAAGRVLLEFLGAFARVDECLGVVSTMSTDGDTTEFMGWCLDECCAELARIILYIF